MEVIGNPININNVSLRVTGTDRGEHPAPQRQARSCSPPYGGSG